MDLEIVRALRELSKLPRVLVCCDYDGTLAPIVADPEQAFPLPEAEAVLGRVGRCPGIFVSVVSGRALADLKRLSGFGDNIAMVGSHGAEFAEGEFAGLGPDEVALLTDLSSDARQIVDGVAGAATEEKPVSVAVHVRRANELDSKRVMAAVADRLLVRDGIFVTHGKQVVEIAVVHADKGEAVAQLKSQFGADGVLFIGDDVTDERAFAKLGSCDVGVKVGDGETTASFRVSYPVDTLAVLNQFMDLRGC
jgi:trehalose-phosphatase